ncbi:cytochrome P450 [Sesbania bispinosa]|nr:cytochrome P450 [Sesbania bispinosa]
MTRLKRASTGTTMVGQVVRPPLDPSLPRSESTTTTPSNNYRTMASQNRKPISCVPLKREPISHLLKESNALYRGKESKS